MDFVKNGIGWHATRCLASALLVQTLETHMLHTPLSRRACMASALSLALAGLTTPLSASEVWPSKPVRIIVPFAPGGAADSSARVLAELLAPQLGQPVVVENRPGAGSAVGVTTAAQAKDGHTLLMGSNSMVINPILNPAVTYDVAKDFDALGMVSSQPLVLVVPADSAIKGLDNLVQEAKAQPGRLTAGNSGSGTLAHLTSVLFELQAKVDLTSVPYRGESALMPDLLSGRVSLGFLNLPSVMPHIRSGRLRALAVSAAQPVPDLPGVPTFRALGWPQLEVLGWAALLVPKGTVPQEGLQRLQGLLAAALVSETVKTKFATLGVAPMPSTRDNTAAYLAQEHGRWQQVIRTRGIKADN